MVAALDRATDVRHFFHEHVQAASKRLDVDTRVETESYLVELLAGFATVPDVPPMDAPLATVFAWALEGRGHERMYRMRCLGDLAMFRCGFFPDSLERRGISEDYVVAMGGRAYDAVAAVAAQGPRRSQFGQGLFEELALRFAEFVRVIEEVRDQTVLCGEKDVARLYERFCESGSPALLRKLHRRGLFTPGSHETH